MKLTIISGTNRRGSNSRRIADHVAPHYRRLGASVDVLDLVEIPPVAFTPEAYDETPAVLQPFIARVMNAAGVVTIVPEYNGSFPGALKLFLDLVPLAKAFLGRPVAFVGVAAGEWGGLRPVQQLQQVFAYRHALQFPARVFVRQVDDIFGADGQIANADIAQRLAIQAEGFVEFLRQTAPPAPKQN